MVLEFHATEVLRSLSFIREKKNKRKTKGNGETCYLSFRITPCGKEICSNVQILCWITLLLVQQVFILIELQVKNSMYYTKEACSTHILISARSPSAFLCTLVELFQLLPKAGNKCCISEDDIHLHIISFSVPSILNTFQRFKCCFCYSKYHKIVPFWIWLLWNCSIDIFSVFNIGYTLIAFLILP